MKKFILIVVIMLVFQIDTNAQEVKNLGENQFSIRVEYEGKVKEKIRLDPSRITRVILPKGHVMYFDNKLKTKTEVSFRALQ